MSRTEDYALGALKQRQLDLDRRGRFHVLLDLLMLIEVTEVISSFKIITRILLKNTQKELVPCKVEGLRAIQIIESVVKN